MSACIEYSVIGDISYSSLDEVNSEIDAISGEYEWYIEPAMLFESNGGLAGASKLFRLTDESGAVLDPSEESSKVMIDIQHLISVLNDFSSKRNISWELAVEGVPVGGLNSNGPDETLIQTLEEMLAFFGGISEAEAELPAVEPSQRKPRWKFW